MAADWGCCRGRIKRGCERYALYRLAMCYRYKDVVLALGLAMDQDDV